MQEHIQKNPIILFELVDEEMFYIGFDSKWDCQLSDHSAGWKIEWFFILLKRVKNYMRESMACQSVFFTPFSIKNHPEVQILVVMNDRSITIVLDKKFHHK